MMTLILNLAEWDAYCRDIAVKLNRVGCQINFGKGPLDFPCLVCSYQPANEPNRFISCYVYVGDAERLMTAAGRTMSGETVTPKAVVGSKAIVVPAGAAQAAVPSQDEYNRFMSASLLAVVDLLKGVGICSNEKYEETLATALKRVDHFTGEQRLNLLSGKPLKTARED